MISLKEAMKLSSSDILELRKDLKNKIKETAELGAYVEQLTGGEIGDEYTGVPIAVKDNIQVKGWNITSGSKILQGYVAPYKTRPS